eukprot:11837942-Heterocapsa_arctica.AAC.1
MAIGDTGPRGMIYITDKDHIHQVFKVNFSKRGEDGLFTPDHEILSNNYGITTKDTEAMIQE